MTGINRRSLLHATGAAALMQALPGSIRRALAVNPSQPTGSIQDVKHIVVLMQENRSFDHYFGAMRGVRGFNDPRAVKLSTGNSVFYQPNTNANGVPNSGPAYYLPFNNANTVLGVDFLEDLAHGWSDAHGAWNYGANDRWVGTKTYATMVYNKRVDIPFHYALADAFTICDAYHCSTMTSTDPNRYYLWSGWLGQNGTQPDTLTTANPGSTAGSFTLSGGNGTKPNGANAYTGPVISNAEKGYNWITYPERLTAAGITWKFYQDIAGGASLSASNNWGWSANHYIGNYGDTSVLYFTQYQTATAGNPLYDLARTGTKISGSASANPTTFSGLNGTLFDVLKADVQNNTLPQVSWIVAPEAYSEHGNWPTKYGAWYISNVLSILASNPTVWASTVLLLCYDENDGFFDHLIAPTPPQSAAYGKSTVSTVNEIYPTQAGASTPNNVPYGLGARVPLIAISPWSKGGFVCSQTFDHTSVIRFIEARFGVSEPNISPWRRAVCGDLTSAFDFSVRNNATVHLPSVANSAPPTSDILSNKTYGSYVPPVPTTQVAPTQEAGLRLARPLPYQLQTDGAVASATTFTIVFANNGATNVANPVAAFFHVRTAPGVTGTAGGGTGPWGYTVEAGKSLSDTWTLAASGAYDLSVHGHNGFFRRFAGGAGAGSAMLNVSCAYDTTNGGIALTIANAGTSDITVTLTENYGATAQQRSIAAGASVTVSYQLAATYNWYDLKLTTASDPSFLRHYAGHVETGAASVSDPWL